MENNSGRTWKDLRAIYDHLDLCKLIMSRYFELQSLKAVAKEYKTSYTTIRNYLDRHYSRFDKEAKSLNAKMEAEIKKKKKLIKKEATAKEVKTIEDKKGVKKRMSKDELIQLKCLENMPKMIRYLKFLDIISKSEVQTFSTDDWLELAASRGIKVVG